MRIDSFRRSVFLSIGLVVTGTLLTSDVMALPASAVDSHPAYAGIHREAIAGPAAAARLRAARQRASRSGTRQRIIPAPAPTTPVPKQVTAAATRGGDEMVWQRLRNCEAGGRYDRNSGNGYYGA